MLSYECCPHSLRPYTALFSGSMWVLGYCILAPMDYLLQSWRHLMLALSVPSILYSIGIWAWAPESFHYSILNRHRKEVGDMLLNTCSARSRRCCSLSGPTTRPRTSWTATCWSASRRAARWRCAGRPKGPACSRSWAGRRCCSSTPSSSPTCGGQAVDEHSHSFRVCDAFIYYGLSLFSTELAGNRYEPTDLTCI